MSPRDWLQYQRLTAEPSSNPGTVAPFWEQERRFAHLKLEVAAGLEPAKTGFADQRLDHFGIATVIPASAGLPQPSADNRKEEGPP
jgi:hypothetical protein